MRLFQDAFNVGSLSSIEEPASFLLPLRQAGLFRWCLGEGLRVVKPMTYMTLGQYHEPKGPLGPVGALLTPRCAAVLGDKRVMTAIPVEDDAGSSTSQEDGDGTG